MISHRSTLPLALALLALMAGCAVGPDYRRPSDETPVGFGEPGPWKIAAPKDALPKEAWWKAFNDAQLDSLEAQATSSSPTVRAALARVDEAAALARISRAELLPSLAISPSAYRERFSANRQTQTPSAQLPYTTNSFDLPFALSYEVDLFGRVRRGFEAAQALAQAEAADYQNVLLSLQALVAENYLSFRELCSERDLLAHTADLRRQGLELVEERSKAGAADDLDVRQAEAEFDAVESLRLGAERQVADVRRAIAVLCGRMPEGFSLDAQPLAGEPPAVPVGLPSELLERRPDVAEAERELAAFNAQIGVAKAAFFPVISLTAFAGDNSTALGTLFDSGSREWAIAPFASLPIFQGGANVANYRRSRAAYEEAVANYRQRVLTAFQDVEDGLSDLRYLSGQCAVLDAAAVAAAEAADLSSRRYKSGAADYFEFLDAERTALSDQLAASQARGQRFVSTVVLIKALGGGW